MYLTLAFSTTGNVMAFVSFTARSLAFCEEVEEEENEEMTTGSSSYSRDASAPSIYRSSLSRSRYQHRQVGRLSTVLF